MNVCKIMIDPFLVCLIEIHGGKGIDWSDFNVYAFPAAEAQVTEDHVIV